MGMVILPLCSGSIRQMFNIWNGTLDDSNGASNCCCAAFSQNIGILNMVPECEITLCSERSSSPSCRGPAVASGLSKFKQNGCGCQVKTTGGF